MSKTKMSSAPDLDGMPLSPAHAAKLWPRSAISRYAFPQPPRSAFKLVKRGQHAEGARQTAPGLPAAGDVTAFPDGVRLRPPRLRAGRQPVRPLFVYPPDDRHTFNDTTYPWRACGRVVTAIGHGAGVLVGPQHLLTASHVVDWTVVDGKIGWLRFEPDFNNGNVFAPSMAVTTYSYERTSDPQGEYDIAEDYVVCVLDRRAGDELGWLGTKTYDDGWDGGNFWMHVGYPDDVGGGTAPAFEGGFSIYNSWAPGFWETGPGRDIETFADLNHGDSGGPIFGLWNDGPYVVGVVSAEGTLDPVYSDLTSRTGNWVAGGSPMPDLVNQARSEHP